MQQYVELHSAAARRSHRLAEKVKQRIVDSEQMNEWVLDVPSMPSEMNDDMPLAVKSGADGQSLRVHVERDIDLVSIVRKFYHEDPMFSKILAQPEAHPSFGIKQNLIWTKNQMNRDVVCLPWKAFLRWRRLVKVILDHTHYDWPLWSIEHLMVHSQVLL